MKLKNIIYIFCHLIFLLSCNNNNLTTQEEEAKHLDKLLTEIKNLANSVSCTDPAEWTFTGYGSKACGGVLGFIAYSKNIDTSLFLKKIKEHKDLQEIFNKKWGVISDCSIPSPPESIVCENGKAVLKY